MCIRDSERIHAGGQLYSCNVCLKKFARSYNLKRHVFTHTGQQPYCCKICGKKYLCSDSLNVHMSTHIHSDTDEWVSLLVWCLLTSTYPVLTGPTDWVCHFRTLTLCIEAVAWSCIIVTWWRGSGSGSSLISTTNWFPVLWHCWFGHVACKNRPWNDLQCVEWDIKHLYYYYNSHLKLLIFISICWVVHP